MRSFVTTLSSAQNEEINACILALHKEMDNYKEPTEEQEYSEITYSGDNLQDIEIKFPRDLKKTIPIIGTAGGLLTILGTTDGKSFSIKQPEPFSTYSFTEVVSTKGEKESYTFEDESMEVVYEEAGQTEEGVTVYNKITTLTKRNTPYSIAMRF